MVILMPCENDLERGCDFAIKPAKRHFYSSAEVDAWGNRHRWQVEAHEASCAYRKGATYDDKY